MARKANPYTKVLKRLAKLQAKAGKLNAEIASFSSFIESASKVKADLPPAKKAPAKKQARKATPKKVTAQSPKKVAKKVPAKVKAPKKP